MAGFSEILRISPELWKEGRFPSREQYLRLLDRGCMLYSLDLETNLHGVHVPPIEAAEADARPINLLYSTCMQGYARTGTKGFKGCGTNEMLRDRVEYYRALNREYHRFGIPVIVYQNENNFDEAVFPPAARKSFEAKLEPFSWAFDNPGRRYACYNKPAWRDFLVERLLIRVGETEADGIFMDNNTPFLHCRCHVCRSLYREEFGRELTEDIGAVPTVIGDRKAFYEDAGVEGTVTVDRVQVMQYLEWRIRRHCDFHREIKRRVLEGVDRFLYYTSNAHIAVPEQMAFLLDESIDMAFSEDGFTAPPTSNTFNLKLGLSVHDWRRAPFILTRVRESLPTADMLKTLAAEGRAMGGQAEFWELNARSDDRLAEAQKGMRRFFIDHAEEIYAAEWECNDVAVVYSWRSDLLTSQSYSPAKMVAHLLEEMNLPYDVLIAEKDGHAERLGDYRVVLLANVEVISDAWFSALQRYLEGSGRVVAMGRTAGRDASLRPRAERLSGAGYVHFDRELYREYYEGSWVSRADYGIHGGYEKPEGELPELLEEALERTRLRVAVPLPLLSMNHTTVPAGEVVHLVNRFTNVFPMIRAVPRNGMRLLLRPAGEVHRVLYLTPEAEEPVELETGVGADGGLIIDVPELTSYGVIKVEYAR